MEEQIIEKTCFKCGESKNISDFYRHKQMADGHLNKCKECTKKEERKRYRDKWEQMVEYERERWKDPTRRAKLIEYQRKRRAKNPEKYKAACAVSNAIRDGRIEKKPCEMCGSEKSEAHHNDYSNPLGVVWLCRKHHLMQHGKVSYPKVGG
jgi:hypothetical protein